MFLKSISKQFNFIEEKDEPQKMFSKEKAI